MPDGRAANTQIPLSSVMQSLLLLFSLGLRSLNELEQLLIRQGDRLLTDRAPSADTIGYALSRVEPENLWEVLDAVNRQALRKKAILPDFPQPGLVAAIDGHEFYKSRNRCCDQCTVREVESGGEKQKEYYHRGVACHLIGMTPPMVLGFELQKKGEGEITAARRLAERILEEYGRLLFAFVMDGLYTDSRIISLIRSYGAEVVVTLKDPRLIASQELQTLSDLEPSREARGAGVSIEYWDFSDMKLGELEETGRAVRVVRTWSTPAREAGQVNLHRTAGSSKVQDWRYLVFGQMSALRADQIGHARWDIENRVFHELSTHGRLNHCFVHEFKAMQNILSILFLTFLLTRLFFERNVKKPEIRRASHLAQRGLLREGLQYPARDGPLPYG